MTTESPESRPSLPDHEIPTMSVDELRGTQLERLQRTVRTAYDNVPHYRAAFEAKGFHPDDLRTLDDVSRMPFTTKADLRENPKAAIFSAEQAPEISPADTRRVFENGSEYRLKLAF